MSEDRFVPRYQVFAYALHKITHPNVDRYISRAIHKSFEEELQAGGASYGKQRTKGAQLYKTVNGLAAVSASPEQSILFSIFCDTKQPYAEFRAGTLAAKALRSIHRWLKPPMSMLAFADGKEVNDLVEVSVSLNVPGTYDPLTPGAIPLHDEHGKTIPESLEAIRDLEQHAVDEYIFNVNKKTNVAAQTRIGTLWHAEHGMLTFPITVARTGTDPPTGATQSP
jgi:hypothetical protein